MLIDGEPVASCLVPFAQAARRRVITIEGVAPDHPLKRCFAEEGAAQCGICTPGHDPGGAGRAQGRVAAGHPGGAGREPLPLHRLHRDLPGGAEGARRRGKKRRHRREDGRSPRLRLHTPDSLAEALWPCCARRGPAACRWPGAPTSTSALNFGTLAATRLPRSVAAARAARASAGARRAGW